MNKIKLFCVGLLKWFSLVPSNSKLNFLPIIFKGILVNFISLNLSFKTSVCLCLCLFIPTYLNINWGLIDGFFSSFLQTVKSKTCNKSCWWLDSNPGPLMYWKRPISQLLFFLFQIIWLFLSFFYLLLLLSSSLILFVAFSLSLHLLLNIKLSLLFKYSLLNSLSLSLSINLLFFYYLFLSLSFSITFSTLCLLLSISLFLSLSLPFWHWPLPTCKFRKPNWTCQGRSSKLFWRLLPAAAEWRSL